MDQVLARRGSAPAPPTSAQRWPRKCLGGSWSSTQSLICGLGKPSRLPDELPDNDRAGRCTGPTSHGHTLSVNGRQQPGRAGSGRSGRSTLQRHDGPRVDRCPRPFDAAFLRMCRAGDTDVRRDELSNMLHHMYRLSELCARRWQLKGDHTAINAWVINVVPGALGGVWIRTYDTHDISSISTSGDVYSDFYTELYGVALWKPLATMPFVNKPTKAWGVQRYNDYQNLEDKAVLDTFAGPLTG